MTSRLGLVSLALCLAGCVSTGNSHLADDETITPAHLPHEVTAGAIQPRPPSLPGVQKLADLERAHIVDVLRHQQGNKSRTARALGIHRRKLYRLIERYAIKLDVD